VRAVVNYRVRYIEIELEWIVMKSWKCPINPNPTSAVTLPRAWQWYT
jgi:hypothetical protein